MKSCGRFGRAHPLVWVLLCTLLVLLVSPAVSAGASPSSYLDHAVQTNVQQKAVAVPTVQETGPVTKEPHGLAISSSTELTSTSEIIQMIETEDGCRSVRSLAPGDSPSAGTGGNSVVECDAKALELSPPTEGRAPESAPPAPYLLSPANDSMLNTLLPLLKIDARVTNVQISPNIWYSRDPDFGQNSGWVMFCGWTQSSSQFQHSISTNLIANTRYYWRARSGYGNGCANPNLEWSAWSPTWSFVTGSNGTILPSPQLLSPANGSTVGDLRPTVSWHSVAGATGTLVQGRPVYYLDPDDFGWGQWWTYVVTSAQVYRDLTRGETYEWYVQFRNDYAWGQQSSHWRFTIGTSSSISGRVTIDGNNGLAGVAISDGAGHNATTGSDGRYTLSNLSAGTYTIRASKTGYVFSPSSRSVTVPPNATNIDFTATGAYQVSGRVTDPAGAGIAGVTVSAGTRQATTDNNGNYVLSGLNQGNYRITPSKNGYVFLPTFRNVTVPPSAQSTDFTGVRSDYTISGRITDVNGGGIAGATVSVSADHTTFTNGTGNYTLVGLTQGTWTVTPSKAGFTFSPLPRTISVPPNATGVDFRGYDKPPIVFVHGWNGLSSSCDWVIPEDYFLQVDNLLHDNGYYVAYASLESSSCYTPPVEDNAWRLDNAIQLAKAATHQPKVILIAHSMGGLVSRAYLEGADYDDDVAQLFTFASPHQGVPDDLLAFFANGLSLGTYCRQCQPAVCDFSYLGMSLFNQNHPDRASDVTYHVVSGDAPVIPRTAFGMLADSLLYGSDDGAVQTWSGLGLSGHLDRWQTDETHGSGSGPRNYFVRDGGSSTSYLQCLKRVLVDRTTNQCGTVGLSEEVPTVTPSTPKHSPFLYGALLPGQMVSRSIPVEGGATLFAAQWQQAIAVMTLVSPSGQIIDAAFAAAHPEIVTYQESPGYATYSFTNAAPGTWQVHLQPVGVPATGAAYTAFASFDSGLALSGDTDRAWYTAGTTAIISATLSPAPQSAIVAATILLADSTSTTVVLTPLGSGRYQGSYTVPIAPGYAEVRLSATGINAGSVPFERGASLAFQIAPNTVSLNGVFSDTPEPRWPAAPIYAALSVAVGVNVNTTGTYGLSADLVDGVGNHVAHANTMSDLSNGAETLTLRFLARDIYAAQRNGPYTLTNLLLTDHTGVTLVAQDAHNVHTTAAYEYRDFRTGDLFLPLLIK